MAFLRETDTAMTTPMIPMMAGSARNDEQATGNECKEHCAGTEQHKTDTAGRSHESVTYDSIVMSTGFDVGIRLCSSLGEFQKMRLRLIGQYRPCSAIKHTLHD